MHDTSMHEFLAFNVKCMKLLFVWPLSEKEVTSGKYALKLIIIIVIPAFLFLLSVMADFYRQVGLGYMDEITNVTENVLMSCCMLVLFYALASFNFKRRVILNLFKLLKELNKFGIPADQNEMDRKATLLSKCFMFYGIIAGSVYFYMPFLFLERCEKLRVQTKYSQHIPCGLFTRIWLPFRFDQTPMFQFAVLFHVYPCYFFTLILLGMYSLLGGFVMHTISHLRHFKQSVYNVFTATNSRQALRHCVIYHINIISFCKHIEACFSSVCFVHMVVTSLVLSILAFEAIQCASVYECFRLFLHFMGWLVALFLVCFSGQQLIDESFSICDTIYDTNWPDADVSVQKYVLLILLRSQKPLTLSAGAFGTPSFAMFLNITSTAYSYFTLLASSQ